MSLVVQGLNSHDCSGTNSFQNPSRCGELSQQIDIVLYYIDSQNNRQPYAG